MELKPRISKAFDFEIEEELNGKDKLSLRCLDLQMMYWNTLLIGVLISRK